MLTHTHTHTEVLNNVLKKKKSGKADMFYSSSWFSFPSFCSPHVLMFSFNYTGPFTSVFVEKKVKWIIPNK